MKLMWIAAALAGAVPSMAAEDPNFCPTRPSLGGSACITRPGPVMFEFSLADWQRDDQPDQRNDRIVAGDILARLGVGKDTELQFGWTSFGHDRARDKATGRIDTATGTGDLTFAIRQHLAGQEGKPLSAGVQAYVTAPTGRQPIGAGTWSIGLIVPVLYDITENLALAFTAQTAAAANQSGDGRHLAYGGVGGLNYQLTETIATVAELSVERDDDPSGPATHLLAALSTAWQPTKRLQLDIQCVAGLDRGSPEVRVVTGGAILF